MSLDVALARISQLQSLFAPPPATAPTPTATAPTAFSTALQNAGATTTLTGTTGVSQPAGPAGQAIVQPRPQRGRRRRAAAGSNDAPRIGQYRQATAGSGVGPWCAYFTSWAAREAGVPLGENGQGFGRVDDVYAWAQRAGKALPNGPGVQPQPAT